MLNTIISFDLTTDEQEWAETHQNRLDSAAFFNASRSGRVQIHPAILVALMLGDGEMYLWDCPAGGLQDLADEIMREACDSTRDFAQPGEEWNFIQAWIKGYQAGDLEGRIAGAAGVPRATIQRDDRQVVVRLRHYDRTRLEDYREPLCMTRHPTGFLEYPEREWSGLIRAVETGGSWVRD